MMIRNDSTSSRVMGDASLSGGSGVLNAAQRTEARFRADTDQSGSWHVWERMGPDGWAMVQRCSSRLAARQLADQWNDAGRVA